MKVTSMTDEREVIRRPADRRERILDAAEKLARRGGYFGFSFRDVAAAVGVKSASIHHHFPTKEDLVVALTARYRDRFLESLGDPLQPGAARRLADAYRSAVGTRDQMCLCGLLAAESDALPEATRGEVGTFYDANIDWAARALGGETERAEALIAGLAGAVVLARSKLDPGIYDRAAAALLSGVSSGHR